MHAAILLDSAKGMGDSAVAAANGVNRHTVDLCVRKCLQFGVDTALGDLPRPGRQRRITDDAIVWVQDLACQKPKELGYPHELWTYAHAKAHPETLRGGEPSELGGIEQVETASASDSR